MIQILKSLALLPVEKILNHLLRNDPYLAAQLAPFDGKTIEVQSTAPTTAICCSIDRGAIRLSSLGSEYVGLHADAVIVGRAVDLVNMLFTDNSSRALANPAISISGDAVLVQELYGTIRKLDIRWQDYLAPFLGDVITNELEQVADSSHRWSKHASASVRRNIDDYLREETNLLPDRNEVAAFGDVLDRLKLDIDRIQARARLLNDRLDILLSD
ncbi:MAG: SCP2 sterol-binding domain-containing protein [Pseudomonadales bacterium]|nr:SCP2 sterol-binding domain-containing protein [Pseudomonadales bacterium]